METEIVAAVLFILRITASVYLWKVLKTQLKLLRQPIKVNPEEYNEEDIEKVWNFRRNLHYITVALFIGNFIPIILDLFVLLRGFGVLEGYRTTPVLILYAISNAVTMLLAAILIFNVYRLAVQTKEVTDLELEHLRNAKNK